MTLPAEIAPWIMLIDGLCRRPAASATHNLNSTQVEVELPAAELDALHLAGFAAAGHAVTVVVSSGDDYSAQFSGTSTGRFQLERETGTRDAVATDGTAAANAVGSAQPTVLAGLIDGARITVSATLAGTNTENRFAWNVDAIIHAGGGGWLGPAQALARAREVEIIEAGQEFVRTETLVIRGSAAAVDVPGVVPRLLDVGGVAEPTHYMPIEASGLASIVGVFNSATVASAWMSVANDFEPGSEMTPPTIVLIGPGRVSVPLTAGDVPTDSAETADAVALWRWTRPSDPDDRPARLEAVRQVAASLIETVADLSGAARPVLSRARFVYEQAKKSAVEAMVNARRAARESTRVAANAAAADARSAARSTSDRTVAAVLASLGVAITHQATALDSAVSSLVLAAVLVGIVIAGIYALVFEFPTASKTLNAVLADLSDTHREVLLREDVDEIIAGPVVRQSRTTIERARMISLVSLAVGVVVTVATFGYVSATRGGTSSATTTSTTTAPTTILTRLTVPTTTVP